MIKLLKKLVKGKRRNSYFTETLMAITAERINPDRYPNIELEYLVELQATFYAHLESLIVDSILKHAESDILEVYDASKDKDCDNMEDYSNFDKLLSFAFSDAGLREKISVDIEEFSGQFDEIMKRSWGA